MESRILADKYIRILDPNTSWEYLTAPQKECNDRAIDIRRGKGLGGSTLNNLCAYSIGPKDDYDEWARIVGDDNFNWENSHRRYKDLENYRIRAPEGVYDKYVQFKSEDHGHEGKLNVEFAPKWESSMVNTLEYMAGAGVKINRDINSGNPLGVGAIPSAAHQGYRHTGASAFLSDAPPNLTVLTNAPASRIIFSGKTAVAVQANSKQCEQSRCKIRGHWLTRTCRLCFQRSHPECWCSRFSKAAETFWCRSSQ